MSLSKPVPTLSQMPWNVKQDIVNSADNDTKFSLRGCSKDFKTLVDSSRFHFNHLILNSDIQDNSISLYLMVDDYQMKGHKVKFFAHPLGFMRQTWHLDVQLEKKVFIGPRNYTDAALAKFFKTIGNPKVSFTKLDILYDHPNEKYESHKLFVLNKIQEFLGSLNHKLSVEAFTLSLFDCQEDILKVLPYFKPGTLELLNLYSGEELGDRTYGPLDLVCELEQWKQANELTLVSNFNPPLEQWVHFSECVIQQNDFTVEYVKQVIEAYSNNPNIRCSEFWFENPKRSNRTEIRNYLSNFKILRPKKLFKVPIANSTDYIEAYVFPTGFSFERCSKTDDDSDSSEQSNNTDEEENGNSDAEPQLE